MSNFIKLTSFSLLGKINKQFKLFYSHGPFETQLRKLGCKHATISKYCIPFLILVCNEEFIELLPPEFKLVFIVLDNSIVNCNGVILSSQECFEGHHGRWSICWPHWQCFPMINKDKIRISFLILIVLLFYDLKRQITHMSYQYLCDDLISLRYFDKQVMCLLVIAHTLQLLVALLVQSPDVQDGARNGHVPNHMTHMSHGAYPHICVLP